MKYNKVIKAIILAALLLPAAAVSSGCQGEATVNTEGLAFYLTATPSAEPEPEDSPVIAMEDIIAYDWEAHEMRLTEEAYLRIDNLRPPVTGLPFAACVNGEIIYRGAFWPMYSSLSYEGMAIWVCPILAETEQAVAISVGYPSPQFGGDDLRGDARIRQVLETSGKLK